MRPSLLNYITTTEEFEQYTTKLFKLMAEDHIKIRIHETYPLKDVARAHNVSMGIIIFAIHLTDITGSRRPKDHG